MNVHFYQETEIVFLQRLGAKPRPLENAAAIIRIPGNVVRDHPTRRAAALASVTVGRRDLIGHAGVEVYVCIRAISQMKLARCNEIAIAEHGFYRRVAKHVPIDADGR